MAKVLMIGGMSGTGKTTLMKKIIERHNENWIPMEAKPLVSGMYGKNTNTFIIGKYTEAYSVKSELFQGSDALSMAAMPPTIDYLKECEGSSFDKFTIIFEGDRLFSQKMIDYIESSSHNAMMVLLEADKEVLDQRYLDRGSEQSEQVLKARRTKYNKIASNLFSPIHKYKNKDEQDQQKILNDIFGFLGF